MTVPLRAGDPTLVNVALGARSYDILIGRGQLTSLGAENCRAAAGRQGCDRHRRDGGAPSSCGGRGGIDRRRIESDLVTVLRAKARRAFRCCNGLRGADCGPDAARIWLSRSRWRHPAISPDLPPQWSAAASTTCRCRPRCWRQVDSSVGGKTAIDSSHGKNLVGAFHQPCLVVREHRAARHAVRPRVPRRLCEVAKYGLLGDAAFFAWLEASWREVSPAAARASTAIAVSMPHEGRDRRPR